MRLAWALSILAAVAAGALAQQQGRVRAGEQPSPQLRGDIHAIADPVLVKSLAEMCGRADAIVDGVVESGASRLMPGRGVQIETDFWIAVGRVLKGPTDRSKIVVSEMGGTVGDLHLIMNFPLLQPGQRYVMFLYADKRPDIPPAAGLARYQAEIFYGTFRVEDGKILPFFIPPFEGKYTGLTTDAFAAEIAAARQR